PAVVDSFRASASVSNSWVLVILWRRPPSLFFVSTLYTMPEGSRSKSRSASSSSSSSSVSTTDGEGLSVIRVDSSEAGLVLGRGGATKRKIENAADVDIELVTTEEGDSNVELRGPGNNRELGRDYICFLLLHKKGESLDINLEDRDDCTWIDVPQDTIGYVTGRERSTMNSMEEETDTLMFFL
ncbi:hypothetical protein FOZ63_004668, partial [Perkinsus olseni]